MDEASVRGKMQSAIDVVISDIAGIRTGRATPALVENIVCPAYGGTQQLKVVELASITSPDPTQIVISPWDKSIIGDIKKGIEKLQLEYDKWKPSFLVEKKKYEDHVRAAGADKKGLEAQRTKLLKEKDQLTKRNNKLKEQITALKGISENRDALIKKLRTVYEEYTTERRDKCSKFESESKGRLKIKIIESTNVDEFKEQLMGMKKGSYLRDADIEQICSATTPYDFILDLLRYQVNKDQKHIKNIAIKVKLDDMGSEVWLLCDGTRNVKEIAELLKEKFKERIEPCHDRLGIFFQQLEMARFISYKNLGQCLKARGS
jgi:ribosome recycling factor